MYGFELCYVVFGAHVSPNHEVECTSNHVVENHWKRLSVSFVCGHRLCFLTRCRRDTTASQGHATSGGSRSRLFRVLGVPQLLVRALRWTPPPSRSQRLLVGVLQQSVPQVHSRFHLSHQPQLVPTRFLV